LEGYTAFIFSVKEYTKRKINSLLFDPEDGDSINLQNVRFFLNYAALQPRKPHSS
jgi:hypothetical protein